ncbi:hemolysin III family protein [Methylomicrobium lacus]|uniref:PAQR family membrane homeostasis protein TrhA n=1 Tax=Methylomicrobium lacus TaxID=136992 RepID=UPI0035A8C572
MRRLFSAPVRDQSRQEEIANSVSHGLGLVAALLGAPFLIRHAARHGNSDFMIGASLFASTMVLLYLLSTFYHALPIGRTKRVFRAFEQAVIFIFIASTYTPFTLGVLHGTWGWTLLSLIWGLATIGVALVVFDKMSHPMVPTGIYLLMGWLIVIAFDPLFAAVPQSGVLLLVAGGVAYTVGVAFLAIDSHLRYGHLIWHLCVIAGTTCHYFAVLWYAA